MNIELIPAIDLIDGKCVRLQKGDYHAKTVYNDDPVAQTREFERLGLKRLHVVDLDGAKSKHVVNLKTVRAITETTSLTVDFGGGIKTEDDLRAAFDAGTSMVTVGSIAVKEPERVMGWLRTYGSDRIILGADVRNGNIAINGWLEDTPIQLIPFLEKYIEAGVQNVLCTDISRDGMLSGPALDLYKQIMRQYPQLHLIASGGVSSNDDIRCLDDAGIPAVVFGKAYYEGKIRIKELTE